MKQHITLEQFQELNQIQYINFINRYDFNSHKEITIGKMIEIIGKDQLRYILEYKDEPYELADALWEAVKTLL